jgi:hypothetical protein
METKTFVWVRPSAFVFGLRAGLSISRVDRLMIGALEDEHVEQFFKLCYLNVVSHVLRALVGRVTGTIHALVDDCFLPTLHTPFPSLKFSRRERQSEVVATVARAARYLNLH